MSPWKDDVFEKWWPLAQSLTLVRANLRHTVKAMKADAKRLHKRTGAEYGFDWVQVQSIDGLFRSIEKFTISASVCYALPTNTNWTVLWDNSFTCTPHDSLAYCLTCFWRLETLTFSSNDRDSTTFAGTRFTYSRPGDHEEVIQRHVYCCNQGSRWHFEQHGEPLPEEDLQGYTAKRKRDRLNEERMMALLERLGIQPWRESSYNLGQASGWQLFKPHDKQCFRMTDTRNYPRYEGFSFAQIQERAGVSPPPEEDQEIVGPPDYLIGRCREAIADGPARLLKDGKWCGHKGEEYRVYDIEVGNVRRFIVRLPESDGPPVVTAMCPATKEVFPIYDSRRHPPSVFIDSTEEPRLRPPELCPKCGSDVFRVAVGFEVPPDATSPNDTSWLALAVECVRCGVSRIVYDDETH